MARGYMGKFLNVNLSTGEIKVEYPEERLYRDFLGGYGIGARVLYSRMKGGVDPLGPDNILGVLSGPFTGTQVTFGSRWEVVAKSPLTGGWGDSNGGGHFAPHFKFSGYDAVFFTGISEKPVYLFIDNGKAELRDASHLWGKNCFETEDMIKAEHGKETESISIGPPGEVLSLLACIVTDRGAVAGRMGMGTVMGSKRLKAMACRGNQPVVVADPEGVLKWRRAHLDAIAGPVPPGAFVDKQLSKYGTSNVAERFVYAGDTPVKNWGGIGVRDMPDASGLNGESALANFDRKAGCWHCPIGCESRLKAGTGEYKYPHGTRRVEYETQGSYGAMLLNNNPEALNMINHLCNCYGIDTISAGCTIAFAMECYEKGLITRADTDGIELTWGNHRAIVGMTEKMVKREGFGAVLADGSKKAAERIGKGSEQYAMHVGGEEVGMHDPRFGSRPGSFKAARYQMDATPGHHTQEEFGPASFPYQVINSTGFCLLADIVAADFMLYITGFLSAVTGWDRSREEVLKCGERILNIRHCFNLREGINELKWKMPDRVVGRPPHDIGPLAGVSADIDAQNYWCLGALDWDRVTTRPSKKKLLELGLNDIAEEFWPPQPPGGRGPGGH